MSGKNIACASSDISKAASSEEKYCGKDDDCFTDSGVITGQNLSCEYFCSEEISDNPSDSVQPKGRKEDLELHRQQDKEDILDSGLVEDLNDLESADSHVMRFDSGVDVGLIENFSSISIDKESRNNLSCGYREPLEDDVIMNSSLPKLSEVPLWYMLFQQDEDGDTQLHIAVIHENENAVRAIIKLCPHRALLDVRNDASLTALHLAVLTGKPQIVRLLVAGGAKVNVRNRDGNTPLHLAAIAGDAPCLRMLSEPAPPPAQALPAGLDLKNYNGETCAHIAALLGHIEILRTLVWYGADINAREGKGGYTPLHVAAEQGNISITGYLIRECSLNLRRDTLSFGGRTARAVATPDTKKLLASFTEADDDSEYDGSEDEYDSEDDEVQFGDVSYFNKHQVQMGAINVA